MIRAVLDTNILASGFARMHAPTSPPPQLVRRWLDDSFELIVSDHIVNELRTALSKPCFSSLISPDEVLAALRHLDELADFVHLTGTISGIAAHPQDDPVLETAVTGSADYLVTGDQELLAMGSYEGVAILTARDLLAPLDRESAASASART